MSLWFKIVRSPWFFRAISFASILLVWLALSSWLGAKLMPGPLETWTFLVRELERGVLLPQVGVTLQRVLLAFALAMGVGLALGFWAGRSPRFEQLLEGWVALGLAIPRILPIVVAYVVLGLNELAAVLSVFLIVLPTVIVQVREGVRALEPRLLQMSQVFGKGPLEVAYFVVWPQLAPFVWGTARATLSLCWKMIVFAELLGRTSGVGYQIAFYFQMFEMRGILAYGLAITLALVLLDALLLLGAQRAGRWRGREAVA
ncbi:ABC transporter permease [Meiothermus ruber]|uniref:ABC transporter permease n=1 Tax=Meiothermus ruber TaxID=277 RepID=UPI00034BB2AE|nr:ABC transporter permease subunit [Meiothermus ruber]GAO75237.1 ABC transporter permease component (Subunit B) [Meiothermus ruber H328]